MGNRIYKDTYPDLGPSSPHRFIYTGKVTEVGADPYNPFRIRVRTAIDRDNKTAYGTEPYCDPFLPIFYNIIPNKGDMVRVILPYGARKGDLKRLWVGPLVSHPLYYKGEDNISFFNLNLPQTKRSVKVPLIDGQKINQAPGIYSNYFKEGGGVINYDESSINGKNNTDLIFREQRVTLRAGKFTIGNELQLNNTNPAYIDLFLDLDGTASHVNIVANKINLLALSGIIKTPAVIEGDWQKIIEGDLPAKSPGLQPLVYGNELVKFLEMVKTFMRGHTHDYMGQPPRKNTNPNDGDVTGVLGFELDKILSKNVKTN